jgi:predicted RNase H-like HicB family nuclease
MIMALYTAIIQKEEDLYIVKCPELGTVSQGKTIESSYS